MSMQSTMSWVQPKSVGRVRREAKVSRTRLSVTYLNRRYPLGSAGRFQWRPASATTETRLATTTIAKAVAVTIVIGPRTLSVLEPRGHDQQDGACRNLTTECDETPRIKMYAEHRRAEAPIAWQDMQQNLPAGGKGSEQRRDDGHALANRRSSE